MPRIEAVWRRYKDREHRALVGAAANSCQLMERVLESSTTTSKAKQLAADLRPLLSDLYTELTIQIGGA